MKLAYLEFHKLTFPVLKVYLYKQNPKIIRYRDYKNLYKKQFRIDFSRELSFQNVQPNESDKFIASDLLNFHTASKEKHIRYNQAAFMNKGLRQAIVTQVRLLNKFRRP